MCGFNDDEICDFVQLTEDCNLYIRLIEYMPFTGNKWNDEKIVSYQEMVQTLKAHWPELHTLPNGPNDTSKVGIIVTYKWREVLLPAHGYAFMRGIQKWYGEGLLFQEIKSCKIAGVVIGWYDLSTSFYHYMVLVVHANEKQQLSLPSLVVKAHGQWLHNGRQLSGQRWTTWFVSKELIKP